VTVNDAPKQSLLSRLLLLVNFALVLGSFYFFTILAAKYYLHDNNHKFAGTLFRMTGLTKGYVLSLIEDMRFDKVKQLLPRMNDPELDGIFAWSLYDFDKAAENFARADNPRYRAYSLFKQGQIDKAEEINREIEDPRLESLLLIEKGKFEEACAHLLRMRDYSSLAKIFFKIGNFPTAIYYLLKTGEPFPTLIARLLMSKQDISIPEFSPLYIKNDFENWIYLISGNMEKAKYLNGLTRQPGLLSMIHYLEGDLAGFFETLPSGQAPLLEAFTPLLPESDYRPLIESLQKRYARIKIFTIPPENVDTSEFNTTYLAIFAVGLIVLVLIFSFSLFYLYRKYQANQASQRQKDLEKMDALSIAKVQHMEARKKRDKTELNVSSFVTLNIQMEVLDLAFTKLALRVNPNKLSEQIEQTKIPNISFKIYTISNSYGLKVKMLSVKPDELIKKKEEGVIILVLKGDLIALLKNVDAQNAYLQFSQKDSRKVPFSALKLSWEGNIIVLNRV
jgi:hypothetical protein